MGLFSRLFGNKSKKSNQPQTKEVYSVRHSVIEEKPLGNVPGTQLPEATIRNIVAAVLKKDPGKVNLAALEWLSPTSEFSSLNFQHSTDKGYSALVSGEGKTYRVVIGAAQHVRLAATDISESIRNLINIDIDARETMHLAAIDGVIYAGWTVIRENIEY